MKKSFNDSAPMWALFSLLVIYFALSAASVYEDGMTVFTLIPLVTDARLGDIRWTAYTLKFILIFLSVYAGGIALYYSTRQNRRPGEEHGSAKWGNVHELNKKYSDKDPSNNAILTKHLSMSLNGRLHMRNLLQIIVGGSGSGKTRFVVKPNLLLANTSFIATDPKGELVRAVAPFLLQQGYVVKVFDLIDPVHSDSYNPFRYIRKDSDVFRLINNFIQNTTPKNASQSDPFWEKSETALDAALMLYLLHEAPPEEQTMEMLLTMIEYGAAKEDDEDYKSPLDLLFEALEEDDPNHIALRQYRVFKQAAGKTAKSILVSAAVRLMFDEFANVALPDGYARLQATMRSRNIMATIILQNISQLKALFKDDWEGIIGNADTLVYLGGNEASTHEYISKLLGKETISTTSSSQSKGRNGSYSQSTQQTGRELMTSDEVRLLDNKNAIVFIRGERPVIDEKYDLMKHPNIAYTEDGGAAPYVHSPHCMYDMRHLLSELEESYEQTQA